MKAAHIFFGSNAWFLQRTVTRETDAAVAGEASSVKVKHDLLEEAVFTRSDTLIPALQGALAWARLKSASENSSHAREGMHDYLVLSGLHAQPQSFGSGAPFNACSESIEIHSLDEGFMVKHTSPRDLSKLASLHDAPGDEWKARDKNRATPAWVEALVQVAGPQLAKGETQVLGFQTEREVISYVKSACLRGDRRPSPHPDATELRE